MSIDEEFDPSAPVVAVVRVGGENVGVRLFEGGGPLPIGFVARFEDDLTDVIGVYVNQAALDLGAKALRYIVAHEMGHVYLVHRTGIEGGRNVVEEREADQYAARVLGRRRAYLGLRKLTDAIAAVLGEEPWELTWRLEELRLAEAA